MGNKVSTTRKLGGVKTSETLVRSQINQLPPKELKQKYETSHDPSSKPPSNQQEPKQNPQNPSKKPQSEDNFLSAITKLGRIIETDTKKPIKNLDSTSLSQLQNRKRLETNDIFTSQQLNDLLLDIHDKRYTIEQVQKDHDLSDEWLQILQKFKVANTYKVFKTQKDDEIAHEGVGPEKQFDDLEKDLEISHSDEVRDTSKLQDRLS